MCCGRTRSFSPTRRSSPPCWAMATAPPTPSPRTRPPTRPAAPTPTPGPRTASSWTGPCPTARCCPTGPSPLTTARPPAAPAASPFCPAAAAGTAPSSSPAVRSSRSRTKTETAPVGPAAALSPPPPATPAASPPAGAAAPMAAGAAARRPLTCLTRLSSPVTVRLPPRIPTSTMTICPPRIISRAISSTRILASPIPISISTTTRCWSSRTTWVFVPTWHIFTRGRRSPPPTFSRPPSFRSKRDWRPAAPTRSTVSPTSGPTSASASLIP